MLEPPANCTTYRSPSFSSRRLCLRLPKRYLSYQRQTCKSIVLTFIVAYASHLMYPLCATRTLTPSYFRHHNSSLLVRRELRIHQVNLDKIVNND